MPGMHRNTSLLQRCSFTRCTVKSHVSALHKRSVFYKRYCSFVRGISRSSQRGATKTAEAAKTCREPAEVGVLHAQARYTLAATDLRFSCFLNV